MVSPVFIRPALVILVTVAIICIVIAISGSGSNHSAPVQSAFPQLPQNIDIALRNARFSEIKDGTVVWELTAGKVEYDNSGEIAHLADGVLMDFKENRARGSIKVVADSGEYRSDSKNLKLSGKVNVLTADGASFNTGYIEYRAAASQLKTVDSVVFRQERLMLNATGMEIDVKGQKARFSSLVDATIAGVSAGEIR